MALIKGALCLAALLALAGCTASPRIIYLASDGSAEAPESLAAFSLDVDCNEFPEPGRLPQSIALRRDPKLTGILREAEDLIQASKVPFFYQGAERLVHHRELALARLAESYAWRGAFEDAKRVAEGLGSRDARNYAVASIAGAYGYRGDIAAARDVALAVPKGYYLMTSWDTDMISTYAAAAQARAGNLRAARRMLRDLGVEAGQADLRMAPWLVDAGRAEEALTLVRGAVGSERHLRVRAFTAVGEAAFRAGRPAVGREAIREAHRLRRESGYAILNVLMFELVENLALVDLLYQEDEREAAQAMAAEVIEDLVNLSQSDPTQDMIVFENLLALFELQRSHGDLDGAVTALKALRRRDSLEPDAAEHWAQVAATRQVWVMIQRGDDKAGLRLAEGIKEEAPRCTALANAAFAFASQGQFARAWQISDLVDHEGCLQGAFSDEQRGADYSAFNPFQIIALEAFSRGDSAMACEAVGRLKLGLERLQTLMNMVRGLSQQGYPELAAAVARSIADPRFRFFALLEAVEPAPRGLRYLLPLKTWWGERLH